MRAIGLSGYAQSGKTTAANYIEKAYGFRRKHIASTLRRMLAEMLCDLGYSPADVYDILEGSRKDGWIIPEIGRTSRELQITIGTEWGRELVHPDLWVGTWSNGIKPGERIMNDSVRFPNEEKGIREKLDGITILITRPGTRPVQFKWGAIGKFLFDRFGLMWGVHDSERIDRLNPDYVIVNDGTVEDLHRQIDDIMEEAGAMRRFA